MAADGAEESCCSQKKPHLPGAEVKVEGENRWLALTQVLTTEPVSTLPNPTAPASLVLRRVRGHAVSNNRLWLPSSADAAPGTLRTNAEKLARARFARFAKQM